MLDSVSSLIELQKRRHNPHASRADVPRLAAEGWCASMKWGFYSRSLVAATHCDVGAHRCKVAQNATRMVNLYDRLEFALINDIQYQGIWVWKGQGSWVSWKVQRKYCLFSKDVQIDIQLAEILRLHGHTLRPIKFDLHVNSRCPCLANHVLPASWNTSESSSVTRTEP